MPDPDPDPELSPRGASGTLRAVEPGRHTRASSWTVFALAVTHALITVLLARARFLTVHHHTYDLALYARLAWGLAHGQAWDPLLSGGALGGHLSLVLAPLGLLGAVFGTVPVLLVAQSAAFAAAAWPLSQLAVRRAGPWGGVLVALAWLLQPNLGHVASYEFHPGSLAVLPLAYALELADREPSASVRRAFLLTCALTVACRASLALQTSMLGLLLLRGGGRWRRDGGLLALASAAWFGLWLLSAGFDRGSSAAGGSLDQHFGIWGGSPLGALVALFTDPAKLFGHLSTPERLLYPLHVLLPFALLPLLSPAALLVALPPLALNLLSEFPIATQLGSHYLTPALPALAWGAVVGGARLAARLSTRFPNVRFARLAPPAALAAAALVANLLVGGMPWSNDLVVRDFRPGRDTSARSRVLAAIGPTLSVQAPDALLPHLIERAAVFRAPPPERKADVVVLDVTHRRLFAHREDLLRTVQEPNVRAWLARDDHQLTLAAGDQLVLLRGRPPREGLARKYLLGPAAPAAPHARTKLLTGCLELRSAALVPGAVMLELVAHGPCPSDLALRLGAELEPRRVDLLFDGLLSPAQLRAGDHLRSRHTLDPAERAALALNGLHVGALRSSGARPEPNDPISVLALTARSAAVPARTPASAPSAPARGNAAGRP